MWVMRRLGVGKAVKVLVKPTLAARSVPALEIRS